MSRERDILERDLVNAVLLAIVVDRIKADCASMIESGADIEQVNGALPLFITGYSEGGAYALEAGHLMQNNSGYASQLNVQLKKVTPMSGFFDLSGTGLAYLFYNISNSDNPWFSLDPQTSELSKPFLTAYLVLSFAQYAGIPPTDMLASPFYTTNDVCLDTLSDSLQSEFAGDVDHRIDDRRMCAIRAQVPHEGPVDLQLGEGQGLEVAEARGPCAEVVDGHADAQRMQGFEGLPRVDEVLHQRGFNATGVQDITDAAGVPKGSFYNHFESKEALGVEALERYWQGALNSLAELKDETVPPIERLKLYFRRLNELGRKLKYRQGCMVGNLSVEMSDQSPIMRERLAVILATWSRAIGACVKEAQEDGSMRRDLEPTVVAAFMLNSWEGTVMRAKVDRSSVPFDQFEKVVFTSLASGD